MGALPTETAGVASAVFNASREVAGLLGITVIGVVLTARRSAILHAGESPLYAFLGGYKLGIIVAGALVGLGGVIAWRGLPRRADVDTAAASESDDELVGLFGPPSGVAGLSDLRRRGAFEPTQRGA